MLLEDLLLAFPEYFVLLNQYTNDLYLRAGIRGVVVSISEYSKCFKNTEYQC